MHLKVINSINKFKCFYFLSDYLIVVPCNVVGTGITAGTLGTLEVYTFDEHLEDSPPQTGRHIASLQLPSLPSDIPFIVHLWCRSDPVPSPSTQSATQHPRIFQLAPTSRVLCLQVSLLVRDQAGISQGVLCVSFAEIMGAVSHLYGQSETLNIPWDDWGQQASWVGASEFPAGSECYAHGQRLVVDMMEVNEAADTFPTVAVFDFEPVRLKYDTVLSDNGQPGLELFNPGHKTILTESFAEYMLRNAFLGGTCKANKPFGMRKTRISYELPLHYFVMVDDEHGESLLAFPSDSALTPVLLVMIVLVNMAIQNRKITS